MNMSAQLRSVCHIEFVGPENDTINGARLPVAGQVFSHFMYNHRTLKKTIRDSARITVREVHAKFWSKTTIPVAQEIKSIDKLEKLHTEWKVLLKNKSRDQEENRNKFTSKLQLLFDISPKDAIDRMEKMSKMEREPVKRKALEDMEFLKDERDITSRHGVIGGIDSRLATDQKKKLHRIERKAEKEKVLNARRKRDIEKSSSELIGR